ncbi:IS110 family transposase [Acidiferrimicrobium sp. IK]|uniref:IS110 family transposase n=1 Tax=Acidiferrimicrobium sp. IK TaxID=2871700 RepID=UPI0021CB1D7E|nr:IS110 family transposase [Acidiferrimicrobium sp. IK]MCU4183564.1 IS110 family transposase [Acidiferrimicrobium sp. IK]
MASVMIGIDPHKASHTAAAIDPAENELGQARVRAAVGQVDRLLAWRAGRITFSIRLATYLLDVVPGQHVVRFPDMSEQCDLIGRGGRGQHQCRGRGWWRSCPRTGRMR